MSRPLKKLTCACCGYSKPSICIDCWERDLITLNDRANKIERRLSILEDPLNEIFLDSNTKLNSNKQGSDGEGKNE